MYGCNKSQIVTIYAPLLARHRLASQQHPLFCTQVVTGEETRCQHQEQKGVA